MHKKVMCRPVLLLAALLFVVGCGGGDEGGSAGSTATAPAARGFVRVAGSVGGSVTGLGGKLVLQNNGGDDLVLTADGDFAFATTLAEGSAYTVSVRTQPVWQVCTVTQDSGQLAGTVDSIMVSCQDKPVEVATFAGSGAVGWDDGSSRLASFAKPSGLAFDQRGNLFVTEWGSHLLRKITPEGDVTTVAGNTTGLKSIGAWSPSVDGFGTAASFNDPQDLTLDAAGNAYVVEGGGHRIRKVTPAGDVTTFAGSGSSSRKDGRGTAASFKDPSAVAIDAAGNLYVTGDSTVRKITPAGDVTTLAASRSAGLSDAQGVAVDSAGSIYVADAGNHRIRKIAPDGSVTTLAGSGQMGAADGAGSVASFARPKGIALDENGNLFVADAGNNLLRKITPTGVV